MLDKLLGKSKSKNPFAGILGTMGSGLASGLTGGLMDQLFGSDPAEDALDMMNTLYPGTTPFERLSAGGGGAAGAGAIEGAADKHQKAQLNLAKRQADMQEQNIDNQLKIANINKDSAENVAKIQAGAIKLPLGGGFNPRGYGWAEMPVSETEATKRKMPPAAAREKFAPQASEHRGYGGMNVPSIPHHATANPFARWYFY